MRETVTSRECNLRRSVRYKPSMAKAATAKRGAQPKSTVPSELKPLRLASKIAIGCLLCSSALHALEIVALWMELDLLGRAQTERIPEALMLDNETRIGLAGFVVRGSHAITACAFVFWFQRAYRRLPVLGQTVRRSGAWPVLMWIVPFVNVVLSLRMTGELFDKSHHASGTPRAADGPAIAWPVAVWWGVWISASVLSVIATMTQGQATTLAEHTKGDYWRIASSVTFFIAAYLAANVVRTITRQQRNAEATQAQPAQA